MKALFASTLSFAALILASSGAGSRLSVSSSGDGTEDGGVEVDATEDEEEEESFMFKLAEGVGIASSRLPDKKLDDNIVLTISDRCRFL